MFVEFVENCFHLYRKTIHELSADVDPRQLAVFDSNLQRELEAIVHDLHSVVPEGDSIPLQSVTVRESDEILADDTRTPAEKDMLAAARTELLELAGCNAVLKRSKLNAAVSRAASRLSSKPEECLEQLTAAALLVFEGTAPKWH